MAVPGVFGVSLGRGILRSVFVMELLTDDEHYLVKMHRMICSHDKRRQYMCSAMAHSHFGSVYYKISVYDVLQGTHIMKEDMLPTAKDAFEKLYDKLKSLKLL